MIQVLHISAECYPAAKTGGLGDVVGSLPKYQSAAGVLSAAIIPKYSLKWINKQNWVTVFQGEVWINWRKRFFSVQQHAENSLGYPLFVVDIPGLFDRPGIYNEPDGQPYGDEVERYITFQQCVLEWLMSFPWHDRPRILHCHDHHSGLIPWMLKYCPQYQQLAPIPTVFTIHNGQYQGAFSWKSGDLLPPYEAAARGLVDWNGAINPMASAVRCSWALTTVSESYLYELHQSSMGLESLFHQEWRKQYGIINGIDAQVWDPKIDAAIQYRLEDGEITQFKARNKKALCEWFNLPTDLPVISFIGRMVGEKGSDLLPDAFRNYLHAGGKAAFLVLGTGEAWTQNQFRRLAWEFPNRVAAVIDYNEALAHQIYAGSDFLIMPSRVEPCGLNQMYSMRYGTIPIVRSVGGLKDTVPDIASPDGSGRGIRFDHFSLDDIGYAIHRAASMWHNDPQTLRWLRERIMAIDFSWEGVVERYFNVYRRCGAYIASLAQQQQVHEEISEPVVEATTSVVIEVAPPAVEPPQADSKKGSKKKSPPPDVAPVPEKPQRKTKKTTKS